MLVLLLLSTPTAGVNPKFCDSSIPRGREGRGRRGREERREGRGRREGGRGVGGPRAEDSQFKSQVCSRQGATPPPLSPPPLVHLAPQKPILRLPNLKNSRPSVDETKTTRRRKFKI